MNARIIGPAVVGCQRDLIPSLSRGSSGWSADEFHVCVQTQWRISAHSIRATRNAAEWDTAAACRPFDAILGRELDEEAAWMSLRFRSGAFYS